MQGLPALWAEAVGPGRAGLSSGRAAEARCRNEVGGRRRPGPGRAGPGGGEAAGGWGATRSAASAETALVRGGGGAAPERSGAGVRRGLHCAGLRRAGGEGGEAARGGAAACAWPTPLWVGWTAPSRGMLGAVVLWRAAGLSPSRGRGRGRAVRAGRRRLPLAASAAAGGEASESLRGRFPGASGREGWGLRRPGAGPRCARSSGCASEVFLPPRADGRLSPFPAAHQGRSSSPPLGPPRGLSPSEGGAAAEGRKAAAGVLQSQVSQEKEQPVCPSCPGKSQRPPGEIQA